MSMISAQCDELRERAKELRNLAPDPDVPYLVPSTKETMALAMRSAAGEMEDAADTIWQLRDDLQRTNAENAKLRELCSKFAQVVANDDVTFRKLREIAKRELGYDFIGAYDSSLGDMDQLPLFSDHMRELGVEVDG